MISMKITAVIPLVLGTPWRNLTFVKVETDSGLYGLGEVRLANRTNALLGYLMRLCRAMSLGMIRSTLKTWTGTPEGVVMGMKEKNWLKPGVEVVVEVEGLGTCTNRMV
jgi:fumarylacetoacetase-like protein